MNPTGPNENFQDSQIRSYAESIYDVTSSKLVSVIAETIGLSEDKDVDGNPIVMDFDYAYAKLREAGYSLDHNFVEKGGSCDLVIRVYKLASVTTFPVATTHSASIGDGVKTTVS